MLLIIKYGAELHIYTIYIYLHNSSLQKQIGFYMEAAVTQVRSASVRFHGEFKATRINPRKTSLRAALSRSNAIVLKLN